MSVVEKRALKLEEVLGLVSLSSAMVYRMMSLVLQRRYGEKVGLSSLKW